MPPRRQDARPPATRSTRRSAAERERIVLDTATRLFTAYGVHAVGMDRLIAESGLGKMSVYRLFPTKDDLVEAYLTRLAERVLQLIDDDIARAGDPRVALHAVLDAIEKDLSRPDFRGCPFGNAAAEYDDPRHPSRRVARDYRRGLLTRLHDTALQVDPRDGAVLGRRLAVLIDGCYLSAAHLGPAGPAADGLALARTLVDTAPSP